MSAVGPPPARILETGFGAGLHFLATWRAWRDDGARPAQLHYVGITAEPAARETLLRGAAQDAALHPLARQLAAQWFGLMPGFHRMVFDDGRVLLTLCVGETRAMLRAQEFTADAVWLHDSAASAGMPDEWDLHALKSVARLCRRGAILTATPAHAALLPHLPPCGFVSRPAGEPANAHAWSAVFEPGWQPRGPLRGGHEAGSCVVIGGGLAGAATANSLARRGWQVQVLDAAPQPAAGASGLPAGLLAPHQSPDDSLLSRLTRAGVRITIQQARALLREGEDWQASGALEHRPDALQSLPAAQAEGMEPWSRAAHAGELQQALLDAKAPAMWHACAAWIKPAALVRALLGHPGIQWRGSTLVDRIAPAPDGWQLLDADGAELAQGALVVVAAAHASAALLAGLAAPPPVLQPVRGQVSWARAADGLRLPPFPLHGNGHLLPHVPMEGGAAWLCGASFDRDDTGLEERAQDHAGNLDRLGELAPEVAQQLAPAFAQGAVRAWTQLRCVAADRRPLVGELAPGLWLATAMGSRGLTFALLCAELMAARLHGEPLPLARKLAAALDARRGG